MINLFLILNVSGTTGLSLTKGVILGMGKIKEATMTDLCKVFVLRKWSKNTMNKQQVYRISKEYLKLTSPINTEAKLTEEGWAIAFFISIILEK